MKKKRVVISSYDDLKNPYFAGGGAHAVHEIAKRLVMYYEVIVLTGRYPKSKNERVDGVMYKRVGTSFLGAQLDQLTFQLCLPFYVALAEFDCWIESFTPPISTAFLPLFTKRPVIGLVHMLSGEDMKRKYHLPFDILEKIGLKTYKTFIVTSEVIKQVIEKATPHAHVVVISNGIDRAISEKQKTKKPYILFLGRIEVNQKGLDLLLPAYKAAQKKINMPLYVVGAGEKAEEEKLVKLIKKYSLEKIITRLGRVTGKEKETLYRDAAFIIVPSRFETFSSVALEALAHARALVCFDLPGLRWVPEKAAIKVQPFDQKALTDAMITVATQHKEAQKLGNQGYMYAKHLTWDSLAKQYKKIIESVL